MRPIAATALLFAYLLCQFTYLSAVDVQRVEGFLLLVLSLVIWFT
jgi:hypothetical protein